MPAEAAAAHALSYAARASSKRPALAAAYSGSIAAHLGSASERPCACRRLQQHAELPLAEGVVLARRPHVRLDPACGQGPGVQREGPGSGVSLARRLDPAPARAASGATPIEPTAWRKAVYSGLAREAEPAASSRVYSRHARSLCLFCGPREVRAGEGESWHGWAGGGRRSRAVAERCERSWSGRCGGWQGGDASGGAAARTGGREEAVAVHAPLRAARGSRPARSGPLRHAHPHPRLAQAAVQHERLQEEDATPRRASAAAAREGNARRASHLEVGGAASHDVVGDEGEEGPAGRRGEGVGLPLEERVRRRAPRVPAPRIDERRRAARAERGRRRLEHGVGDGAAVPKRAHALRII